jgi:hypothetical protein
MGKLKYSGKLLKEIVLFAKENKIYWIIPLVISLLLVGMLTLVTEASTPFIYTLF